MSPQNPETKKMMRTVSVPRRQEFIDSLVVIVSLWRVQKNGPPRRPVFVSLRRELAAAGRQVLRQDLRAGSGGAIPRGDRGAVAGALVAGGLQRVGRVAAQLGSKTARRVDGDD